MSDSNIAILNLDKLLINPENFRYNPVDNQTEALKIMVEEQGNKITVLIKDIVDNGLNPSDLVIVSQSGGLYLVLEGNRRITSLKIINNPDIIKNIDLNMWKNVNKFLQKSSNSIINDAMCVIFKNEEDAYKWIKLKHTGENDGKGTVTWNGEAVRRFDLKTSGIKPIALQVIDFINESDEFNEIQKNKLKSVSITNLERLISDPHVREAIGFKLKNGMISKIYSDTEISKGLNKVIDDLSQKDFTVRKIYTKSQRLDYVSKFGMRNLPDSNKKLEKEVQINNISEITIVDDKSHIENTKDKTDVKIELQTEIENTIIIEKEIKKIIRIRDKKFSYERKYLIPTSFVIKINNNRINDIYKELKLLEVNKFINAVAVLFRVFIELSLDEYIIRYPSAEVNNDSRLNKKLQYCLGSLKSKSLINEYESKPVNAAISSPNSIFSINTFNGYVHNQDWHPSGQELKISWNNFEKFINILWNAL